jgi:hypothetical protein
VRRAAVTFPTGGDHIYLDAACHRRYNRGNGETSYSEGGGLTLAQIETYNERCSSSPLASADSRCLHPDHGDQERYGVVRA